MFRRILVPTDFSACSINSIRYAVQLAKAIKAEELLIMHAFVSPVAYGEMGVISIVESLAEEQNKEIKENFDMLKKVVPELKEVKYSTLTKQAMFIDALISMNFTAHIDLVIMGTKGATGIDEIIFGTNTYTAIKESKFPILAIPEKATFKRIDRIALASDFKKVTLNTLAPMKALSKIFGSTVSVVHINDGEGIKPDLAEEAKKFERFFKNINHQYHYIKNGDVEEGLNQYLQKHEVDMLTLIPRKHPLLDRVFGSGESKSLIFHTTIPLLALPEVN